MTKISIYSLDEKITALDKWIGSDVNQQNRTKNFTPKKLAEYFNDNQIINIGAPLQYKYYTLDPLEVRPNGTLTFETEIGPTVPFSSITNFVLSKYTTKENIVSEFLNFLSGCKVLLFKSSDVNSFGLYKISDIAIYDEDPNFYLVTVEYEDGNGSMEEDEDYMISLVSLPEGVIPTKTSDLINDGEDGVNPFISELDINKTEWDQAYDSKINSAEVTGTTTKTLTLNKQDGSTITASWTDENTGKVTSVFGRTGDVVAETGDYDTSQVTETTDKRYQTDLQDLYNDATSSIQDQLDSKANDSNVVHRTGNESVLGVKSFDQTNSVASRLDFSNSSDTQPSIKIDNYGNTGAIDISNYPGSNSTAINISNSPSFASYGIIITNPGDGNGILLNNNGAASGLRLQNGGSGAGYEFISASSNGSGFLANTYSPYNGFPILINRESTSVFSVDHLGNATANSFVKIGGTSSQYLMADGTVSTGPVLTGFVPYTGATQDVDLGANQLKADSLAVSLTSAEPINAGEIVWNPIDGTFDMGLLNGVTLQNGQEIHFYGKALGAITNGQAVMFAGSQGDHLLMSVATQSVINANPEYFIGVATQDFVNNEFGYVTVLGKVRELNTTIYSGAVLYFDSSGTTPGALTTTMPVAPNAKIIVAAVVRVHATQGILMVRPHTMPKIKDLQDVYANTPANNNGLFWNSATLRYENNSIVGALGYTPYNATNPSNYITLSSLSSSATGLTYTNTTGVFSLTSGYVIPTTTDETNWNSAYTNRITSASSPLSISSNSVSITQSGSSSDGYLSSGDWNIFNNKQASGNYITDLTGEATASGPGSASVTLSNSAVTGKVLTGVNITGGTIVDTDSILTAFGKVQNQINALISGSSYQGTWDASINTPTIVSGVGSDGDYYIVSVAGTTNIDGINDWQVGDWIIFHGTAWQKVDNTDAVVSVNGFTGAVSLSTSDISEGTNLYYTESRVSSNTDVSANTAARHDAVTLGTTNGLSLSGQQLSLGLSSSSDNGALSSTDWNTFNNKQNTVTLTTTGNNGSATFVGGTLNIPTYTLSGLGGQPLLSGTGIVKSTAGTISYLTDNSSNWNIAYDLRIASTASPLSISSNVLLISQANTSTNGYLSSTDWNTFNNKQVALNGTGFVKISGTTISYDNSTYYLASNPNGYTSNVGTVTSVSGAGGYGGLTLSGTVTSSGNLTLGGTPTGTWPISVSGNAATATNANYANSSGTSDTTAAVAGTINYVPKFTSGNTIGNSLIYDNGTNVGIGTTSPSKSLHVIGSSLNSLSGQSIEINPFWDSGYGAIGTTSNHHLALVTNSSEKIRITSGGNVGIGTSNPTSQVDILSNKALFSGTSLRVLIDSNTNQGFFGVDGTGTGGTSDKIYFGGRGDSNEGFIGSFSNLNFQTAYSNRMIITSGGNVGIGTTSPATKLDVVGAITASGGFFNSDIRLKELVDYKYSVADIKPITYLWKDGRDDKKHIGYSAQEVQKVMPDAVNESSDGFLSVNYVEVLVAKIHSMELEIEQLKSRL